MSVSALSAGLSGLQSYQRALDISGNNVANALTAGFQPQQAGFQEAAPSGSGVSIVSLSTAVATSAGGPDTASGTDLATDMVNQLIYRIGFEANAKVIKTSDQMLGTLLDTSA